MRHVVVGVCAVVLIAGCGSDTVIDEADPVGSPYDGPMSVTIRNYDAPDVLRRSGAAGLALECDGAPYNGGGGQYSDGLSSVQDSAEGALGDWLDNEAGSYGVPEIEYRVEREDDNRVLFSYDNDGGTKIAFIAADGIRDYDDDTGWGIESWAACDPAELPEDVTEALDIGVWEDATGARVPVDQIRSFQGAEHCDWQNITFLDLNSGRSTDQYVRDATGELADSLRTTYDPSAVLPDDATDTGFRRGGRQLWLDSDHGAAFLVSIEDPNDIERWPSARKPIYCA